MRHVRLIPVVLISIFAVYAAQGADYDPFVGTYEGQYVSPDGDPKKNRDLSVEIKDISDGFNVSWETVTYRKDEPKSKSYSIDFIETDRPHIYVAAQKKNLFGGRDPLDPMKGEPYAWARIIDNHLTVHMLLVTHEGGYEMLTYDRILTDPNNLLVRFTRIEDGELAKTIEANCVRK